MPDASARYLPPLVLIIASLAVQDRGRSEEDATMSEIIVTAQKHSERLLDVPMSVSAISGSALDDHGVSAVGDLEKFVPSLSYTQTLYGAPILTIRGMGFFDESVGASPAVTVYVDQSPIPFSRETEGVALDIERVEVMEGPQGTLFGQNSTGGAINYIAAKPTSHFAAGADLGYGRFDDVNAQGFVSGPLSNTVAARLAVATEERGPWQQSVSRDVQLGRKDFQTARLLVDWTPSDALKLEFSASGWRDGSDTQANQFQRYDPSALNGYGGTPNYPNIAANLRATPPAPANDRAADWAPGFDFTRNDNFYHLSLRGDWAIDGQTTLTSLSSYSHLKLHSPVDADGTQYPILLITLEGRAETYAQELRLDGHWGEHLRWMAGGNYQHDDVPDRQGVANQGSNSGVGPVRFDVFSNHAHQRIETKAGFGGADYDLLDTLTLQTSARYTTQDRSLDGCLVDGDGGLASAFGYLSTIINGDPHFPAAGDPSYIPKGGCTTFDSTTNLPVKNVHRVLDETNTSWRAALSWKPVTDFAVYGSITRGYKGGSFGTIAFVRSDEADPIKQESVTAFELGSKAELLQRKLELSGSAFLMNYTNKQLVGYISDSFFGSLPGLVSIPKSRVTGAEASLAARPVDGLKLSAGVTYLHTEVLSDFGTLGPLATSGSSDVKGEPFPSTPKWTAVADAEYRFNPVAGWSPYAGISTHYRDKAPSTFAEPPEFEVKAYTLLDARLGIENEDRSWRFELWGSNITNVYYWRHVDHQLDTVTRVPGMPATYGATLSARF